MTSSPNIGRRAPSVPIEEYRRVRQPPGTGYIDRTDAELFGSIARADGGAIANRPFPGTNVAPRGGSSIGHPSDDAFLASSDNAAAVGVAKGSHPASSSFVKLQVNDENVQPPIFIATVGGRPSNNPTGWRADAANMMLNSARALARNEFGQVENEPPFPALLMGKEPGAEWYATPKWEPEFLPRYADALIAWGREHLAADKVDALKGAIKEEVILLDRKERGGILETVRQGFATFPKHSHPVVYEAAGNLAKLEELEHRSIYAFE